jgi:hypothetical protein
MSDPKKFLTRWSRRKRKSVELKEDVPEQQRDEKNIDAHVLVENDQRDAASTNKADSEETAKKNEFAFDLKSLPPIESIVAATDIRPFLAPGVPAELTRAALRRAWVADPAIRDFIGLSENAWDFTKSDAISGFGPLQMTDELKRIVTEMFEHVAQEKAVEDKIDKEAKAIHVGETAEITAFEKINTQRAGNFIASTDTSPENSASQQDRSARKTNDRSTRRGHGSALPKLVR